jgi:hypothetical protein
VLFLGFAAVLSQSFEVQWILLLQPCSSSAPYLSDIYPALLSLFRILELFLDIYPS